MLNKLLDGQLAVNAQLPKNKPAPKIENGLINFSKYTINQFLDIQNLFLNSKGYCNEA